MEVMLQFFGRVHPLVLHAPIGLLIGLAALEVISRLSRQALPVAVRATLVWLIVISAAVSVTSGLLLAEEGGYASSTVQLHQWLGIGVAVASLLAALALLASKQRWYGASIAISVALIIPAGHFGASMTHGPDFLLEPFMPRPQPPAIPADVDTAQGMYVSVIAPILSARCAGCHGMDRDKGGLRLHTPEAIMRGGDSGLVLLAGNAEASTLLTRMRLPLDHDDHMPPDSKPQPAEDELLAIEAWINAGAPFDGTSGTDFVASNTPASNAKQVAPPAAAIQALREALVHIEPTEAGSLLLRVDASTATPPLDDARFAALLQPVTAHIAELSLARTHITDASAAHLAAMPNLRRLNLSQSTISDATLIALADHPAIEHLVLTQNLGITDASIDALSRLPGLTHLYLWGTSVSPTSIAQLRRDFASATIDLGDTPDAAPLPDDSTEAASQQQAIDNAVAQALAPSNTICPVSAKPVDPRFAVVHGDRVIAFCCADCLSSFVREPERYTQSLLP
jgi:hypothetical protein